MLRVVALGVAILILVRPSPAAQGVERRDALAAKIDEPPWPETPEILIDVGFELVIEHPRRKLGEDVGVVHAGNVGWVDHFGSRGPHVFNGLIEHG